jgi:short-subunit dehydrogenase
MIAYASSKAFINTFGTSLRSLAHSTSSYSGNGINGSNTRTNSTPDGIEVTTILPGYIELGVMDGPRGEALGYKLADRAAKKVVNAVERGGEGVCVPGITEGLLIYALKGVVVSRFHSSWS